MRNWAGRFIQVASVNLGAASILVAEVTIMRNGIGVAVQVGHTNIHIEGNNKILIQVVEGHIQAS